MSVMLPTHVVDCGTNKSTVYVVADEVVLTFAHDDLLNFLGGLPEGCFVFVEYSHLGCPRTKFSLSQPYPASILLELYERLENNGVKLRFFPQKSTPRACAYSDLPKSDENDPKSIYLLVKDFPEIVESAMKPPKTFDANPKREESYEYKDYTNLYINMARREEPKYSSDQCSVFLRTNTTRLYDNLSPKARDAFGFTELNKKGEIKMNVYASDRVNQFGKKGEWQFNKVRLQALYAISCTLINPDGELRVRPHTGEVAGWGYIKRYIIRMSPYHLKGGVARSNLYHHGLKNYVKRKAKEEGYDLSKKSRGGFFDKKTGEKVLGSQFTSEENQIYKKYRKVYCDCIREVWQLVRDMKKEEQGSKRELVNSSFTTPS